MTGSVAIRRTMNWFEPPRNTRSLSVQHVTELAVLPSEIEQLLDLQGYLKVAAEPCSRHARIARPRAKA